MPYAYQASVVIPAASGSTQTNISLVITGTAARLRSAANGGAVQNTVTRVGQTVPADLILSSDTAGTLLYNWGWDFWDPVNGIATIWLLMPSHSSSSSTTIYISVGNVAVTTYQGGTVGSEFDANTILALHLSNGTTLSGLDSSASTNPTTVNSATATTGQIDGGAAFSGSSQSLNTTSTLNLSAINKITVEFWLKWTTFANNDALAMEFTPAFDDGAHNGFLIDPNQGSGGFAVGFSKPSGSPYWLDQFTRPTAGVWHHYAITMDRSTPVNLAYVDGASVTLSTFSHNGVGSFGNFDNSTLYFMSRAASTLFGAGSMDEVKLSTILRSANWIATEFANQNSIPAMSAFSALGTAYTKVVAETYTITDSIFKSLSRSVVETLTLAETFIRHTARSLADTLTLVETYNRLFTVKRAFAEVYALLDSISLITPSRFTYNEIYTLAETFIAKLLRDPSIAYYRQYMLDLTGIAAPSIPPSFTFIGPADPSNEYYRRYLGKV